MYVAKKYSLKDFIYLFLETGEGRDREGEEHQCMVASHALPTAGLFHNPGMCSEWELNQQTFGSQAGSEPHHQPWQNISFII